MKARDGRGKKRWITQEESNAWVHLRVASPRKRILARGESCRPRLPGGGPPGREASGGEAWRGQKMPFSSHMKPRAVYCLQALITTVVFPHVGCVSIRDIPGPCDRSGEVNRAPAALVSLRRQGLSSRSGIAIHTLFTVPTAVGSGFDRRVHASCRRAPCGRAWWRGEGGGSRRLQGPPPGTLHQKFPLGPMR